MTKCYLDSNILIYFKDERDSHHKEAKEKLNYLISEKFTIALSPLVLDEFLHGYRRNMGKHVKNVFSILKIALTQVLDIPSLTIVNPPLEIGSQKTILDYMEKYGLRPRDAYHLLTMTENGIDSFATFDSDFDKVFSAGLLSRI